VLNDPEIASFIHLSGIELLGDRGLRVVVQKATGAGYALSWDVVVGFLVRGDPFPRSGGTNEVLSEVGSATAFLDMIRSESHAEPDYVEAMHGAPRVGAVLRHWRISTMDCSIEVAATREPDVRKAS
jgi:hypothetical protein